MSEKQPKSTLKAKKVRLSKPKTNVVTNKQAKSTVVEIYQRVSEVQALLLEGRTRSYILRYGTEKWKVSEGMIDRYIVDANAIVEEINHNTSAQNLSRITNSLYDLYRRAIHANELGEARQALMSIAKLRGLDIQQISHTIEKRDLATMSDDDIDNLLETPYLDA
jgi:hypothetical protein